ncbi:endonuclease/exonuclease/phosphatase family protein [Kitasatospora sp. NPDC004669]|uniref:endonuclease/exonuclease/phosphatase family protein n=1 Tax=Kitasatospora sp. NPDC004669 TaxID=3154555 RepID=UPI0033B983FF
MMGRTTKFRFLVLNGEHDFGGHETPEWRRVHEWIRKELDPDVILRQEMTYSTREGRRGFHAARHALGMTGVMAAGTTLESPNPTGIFVKESGLRLVSDYPQVTNWWHPATQVRVAHVGEHYTTELSLASVHLDCNSPTQRLREAEMAIRWGGTKEVEDEKGQRRQVTQPCIMGGDFNSYSSFPDELGPLPDMAAVRDRHHVVHRTLPDRLTPDTRPWDTLNTAGFTDLALHAHHTLGQRKALRGTSHRRTDQGAVKGQQHPRIDFIFANGSIPEAVERFEVVEVPGGASDHHGLYVVFSPHSFWQAVEETARPR